MNKRTTASMSSRKFSVRDLRSEVKPRGCAAASLECRAATLLLAACIAAFAASQCFAAAPLKIGEAVSITLKNNSELRSLRQELIKAEAFKLAADGTLLPSLSVSGAAGWQREPQTNDGERDDDRSAEATLEQVVYSGGRNSAIRAQSPQVRTIAEMAIADGENGAVGELFARFYNVLLQKKYK